MYLFKYFLNIGLVFVSFFCFVKIFLRMVLEVSGFVNIIWNIIVGWWLYFVGVKWVCDIKEWLVLCWCFCIFVVKWFNDV